MPNASPPHLYVVAQLALEAAADTLSAASDIFKPLPGTVPLRALLLSPRGTAYDWDSEFPAILQARDQPPADALQECFAAAARDGANLLLVLDACSLDGVGLHALQDLLASDEHFGFAVPRLAAGASHVMSCVASPPIPVKALDFRDPFWITDPLAPPCVLISHNVLRCLPLSPSATSNAAVDLMASFVGYASQARRLGFRTVVSNRTAVTPRAPARQGAHAPAGALSRRRYYARLERMLAAAAEPKIFLLDATPLPKGHNGTSETIRCILAALERCRSPVFDYRVLVRRDAYDFHGYEREFGPQRFMFELRSITFDAGVRLAQPWSIDQVAYLHASCRSIAFFFHDTIAWDVEYAAVTGLDRVWRLTSRLSDGLLFNSDYTRRKFTHRFGCPQRASKTIRLSQDPRDYAPSAAREVAGSYVLVMGNRLDHKRALPVACNLAKALPGQEFVLFGVNGSGPANLKVVRGGGYLNERALEDMFSRASAVVYPSTYEGFGLPVQQSLAFRKRTYVQSSHLWHEVTRDHPHAHLLRAFTDEGDLIRQISADIATLPTDHQTAPPPSHVIAKSWDWSSVARSLQAFCIDLAARPFDEEAWSLRDAILFHDDQTITQAVV
ncbi:MAG TPA: hypothetical protein VGU24_03265 [Microvirga sp.]|jgi:glycosyltransferase involved in cell wall biosynthesis|nr:hypothetical protein [Microvirga sp.]